MNNDLWVNQTELAELLDISRVTLTARQREGLPFKPGPGGSNRYYWPLALYWEIGRTAMTTRGEVVKAGLRAPALAYAVGRLVASQEPENIELGKQTLIEGLGLDEKQAGAAFESARGWWLAAEGRIPDAMHGW